MKRLFSLIVCLFLSITVAFTQAGANDPTFNPQDIGFNNGYGFNQFVEATILQPDGKLIVLGQFNAYTGVSCSNIVRLNTDGSVDTSFNTGTAPVQDIYSYYQDLALQPDGKILAAGQFNIFGADYRLVRLHTDGSIDTSFNIGSGFNNAVRTVAIQSDGKIIVGGLFTTFNGMPSKGIVRLNTDGSMDTTFTAGTGFGGYGIVGNVVIQPDQKILAGGYFDSYNGATAVNIIRLNMDGSTDTTFTTGSGFDGYVVDLEIQPNGKILASGFFNQFNSITCNNIARLNTNGSLDSTFNPGTGFDEGVRDIALQPNGKITMVGYFTSLNGMTFNRIARLNSDGSTDMTFNPGTGFGSTPGIYVNTLSLQQDGKIIAGGYFSTYDGNNARNFVRIDSTGNFDANYDSGPGTGFDATVEALEVQSNDKILVGGSFTTINGLQRNGIARLNPDGTPDITFDPGRGINGSYRPTVFALASQTNGKVIISGRFDSCDGNWRKNIARLNADGSLDTTFNPGMGFNYDVNAVAVQADGKVIAGGEFTTYDGDTIKYFARLNIDGSLDSTFNTGAGFSNWIFSILLQSNGKILVGGSFQSYDNTTRIYMARLNTDGSLDATFNPGATYTGIPEINRVTSIVLQPDGKVITGTNSILGSASIIRLNADGTFNTIYGSSTLALTVSDLVLQSDGKLLAVGESPYCPVCFLIPFGIIGRYNTDGTLDTSFLHGGRFNHPLQAVAKQSDGKILAGGEFTYLDSTGRNRLARLISDVTGIFINSLMPSQPYCAGDSITVSFYTSGSFNNGNIFTLELSNSVGDFTNPTVIGSLADTTSGTIIGVVPSNISGTGYRVRVVSDNPVITGSDNGSNVMINTIVTPTLTISGSATTICSGDSVIFTATPTNGGNTPSYQWKHNGNNVGADSAIYVASSLTDGDVITCELITSLSCVTANTAISNTLTIGVLPAPIPTITQMDSMLTSSLATSYQWLLNGNPINGATGQTYIVNQTGIYQVIVTNANGCPGVSDTLYVNINLIPLPPSNLDATSTLKMQSGAKIQLTWNDNSSTEDGFIIQQSLDTLAGWFARDSVPADAVDYLVEDLLENTTYFYRTASYNTYGVSAFSNTASATTLTSSIEEQGLNNPFKIVPNPSDGGFTLTSNQPVSGDITIEIIDPLGQVIVSKPCNNTKAIELDLTVHPAGIYILSVRNNAGTRLVRKIIIH